MFRIAMAGEHQAGLGNPNNYGVVFCCMFGDKLALPAFNFTEGAGALPPIEVPVPARTRKAIMVNDSAGSGYQLATGIRIVSGPYIVVERPMYFNFSIYEGGHDVVGYAP